MNELELADAKGILNWQHWAPPLVLTLVFLVLPLVFKQEELFDKFLVAVLPGVFAAFLWLVFLRNKQRLQQDVDRRVIEVVEGSPEKVWRNRLGVCYVSLSGKNIRVPAEYYVELQEATSVTLEYLPESLIALHIKPHRGLHLK